MLSFCKQVLIMLELMGSCSNLYLLHAAVLCAAQMAAMCATTVA